MENSKVSVIVPVYNCELYIGDTLTDLIEQTYENIEIIVVDDGSTDNSVKIIVEMMGKDSRINLYETKHRGPSGARNIGLKNAKGKYIRFIDADDRIPRNSIQVLMNGMVNTHVDMVIGNYKSVPLNNYFTGEQTQSALLEQREFLKKFIRYSKSFYYGVTWNKLYKKEILDKYKITFNENFIWCEDFLFNVEYYKRCNLFSQIYVENGVYSYCHRENSITATLSERKNCRFKEIDKLRYQMLLEYSEMYGMRKMFELEWKYSDLYDKLSAVTKLKKSLSERYAEYKMLLSSKEVRSYIEIKVEQGESKVWRKIQYSINYNRYIGSFMFFWVKGVCAQQLKPILPLLRKRIQKLLPKSL